MHTMARRALSVLPFFLLASAGAAGTLFEQARAATAEKKYEEALEAYDAILKMRGEDASVRHNRALIYLEMREIGRARAEAVRAVELLPGEGRFLITLAVTHMVDAKPDLNRAERLLRRAVRLMEKRRDYAGLASAYYNLGVIEQRRLDLIEARELYMQALQYDPANESVRLALEILPPAE